MLALEFNSLYNEVMRFLAKVFDWYCPLLAVEWVTAIFAAVTAVYIFTPLYRQSLMENGANAIVAVLAHPDVVFTFAAVLLISSLLVMYGLIKKLPRYRSAGWFGVTLARIYLVLSIFLTTGLLPFTWIYPLTLTVISLVFWINARIEVNNSA